MSKKTNLMIDLTLFCAFLVADNPFLTGIAVHEWLGLAFAFTILVHLTLHWKWLITVMDHFFQNLFHPSRLNFLVDLLFFIAFIGTLLSGVMISQTIMSLIGWTVQRSPTWRTLHNQSANLSLILLAVHLALHWDWVVSTVKRTLITPVSDLLNRSGKQIPDPFSPEVVPVSNDISTLQDKK